MGFLDGIKDFRNYRYFKEVAFLIAVLLILGAWKFGIEGLTD